MWGSNADLKAACAIRINKQSPDIAGGVNVGHDDLDVGAGDQNSGIRVMRPRTLPSDTLDVDTSGKELIDVRKNGDFQRLRPDGKTQVTIEYVPQVVDEIIEVVRLIPQERVHAPWSRLSTSPYHRSSEK